MADVKKAAAAAKMAAKPVVETKETEVKAEVKKAAAKPATAKKAPAKKAEAKPAAKKETVKKAAPAKKAAAKPAAKKAAPAKKAEAIINFQFAGKEYKADDFVAIAKDVWKYDLGNKPADFKTVELYVKPEEAKVYYVINGDVTGDFDI